MVMKTREVVTQCVMDDVVRLRAEGYTRLQIAEALNTTFARVKYIISLLPKTDICKTKKVWYKRERYTITDAMPNPFPKWWCDKHNLDHNFYRIGWKK